MLAANILAISSVSCKIWAYFGNNIFGKISLFFKITNQNFDSLADFKAILKKF